MKPIPKRLLRPPEGYPDLRIIHALDDVHSTADIWLVGAELQKLHDTGRLTHFTHPMRRIASYLNPVHFPDVVTDEARAIAMSDEVKNADQFTYWSEAKH